MSKQNKEIKEINFWSIIVAILGCITAITFMIIIASLMGCISDTNSDTSYDPEYDVPYSKELLDESHKEFLRHEKNQADFEHAKKYYEQEN